MVISMLVEVILVRIFSGRLEEEQLLATELFYLGKSLSLFLRRVGLFNVKDPVSGNGLERTWKRLMQREEGAAELLMTLYGGKMDKFTKSATPFPCKAGNFYMLYWNENTTVATQMKSLTLNGSEACLNT
ncbi:hypothetical protein AgCh_020253 [Apium graveolens]